MTKSRSLALVFILAIAAFLGFQGASAQGGFQWADAFRFADAPDFQDTGNAWLLRADDHVTTGAFVYDAEPGAYTMWWLVWNTPEDCLEPWACTEADLFNPNANLAIGYAGGASVGSNGKLYISSNLSEGTPLIGFPYPEFSAIGVALEQSTLIDSKHAEIHLVLRSHENPIPVGDALRTFNGQCTYSDPIADAEAVYGTPGSNTCEDTFFVVFPSEDAPAINEEDAIAPIGALLPLSGSLSSYGETSLAALRYGAESAGVNLRVEDTETDPEIALAKLQALHDAGIRVVIGPFSSAEVQAVIDFANENDIILISPLSTARTLAIANDSLFRFTPDDEQEGAALAALARERGYRVILPVSRADSGNLGLQSAFEASFEMLGGQVASLITYEPGEEDFSSTIDELAANFNGVDEENAAIYLTAFAEVTDLFGALVASDATSLKQADWLGSDSVALSADLIADPVAATFASTAYYPNPILGLSVDDMDRWQPVSDQIEAGIGRAPDAFALAGYDALIVAEQALTAVADDTDSDALKRQIVEIAEEHIGLTGPTKLNDAGDRSLGNYDFWSVCRIDGSFVWTKVATYAIQPEDGATISHLNDCSE